MIRFTLAAALALFSASALADTPQTEVSPDANSTECTMNFLPATCSITYGGEFYEATGVNSCLAIVDLVEQVRGAAAWFVDPAHDVMTAAQCSPSAQ